MNEILPQIMFLNIFIKYLCFGKKLKITKIGIKNIPIKNFKYMVK